MTGRNARRRGIDAANWVRVLARLGAEEPRIVVPGHGIQADPEIIRMVRDYIIDLGQRVKSRREKGEDLEAIVASLGPEVRSEHSNWSQPEGLVARPCQMRSG